MDESNISEKESLELINRMLVTVKGVSSETGVLAMLWGSVIAFCSYVLVVERLLDRFLPFDIFILTLIAVIPTIIISIRQSKKAQFKSFTEIYLNKIWLSFGIAIFVLAFILNVIFIQYEPAAKIIHATHEDGSTFRLSEYISALYLMLYGIPTFATGTATGFKPMIWGGIVFWVCAIVSLFTVETVDLFLQGSSAIVGWLIPGIILWKKRRSESHV